MGAALAIPAIHFAYRGMTWLLEERPAEELSVNAAPQEVAAGFLVGAGAVTLTVVLISGFGFFRFEGIGSWAGMLSLIPITARASYIEVMARGVLFRIVEERAGCWWALAISIGLFGLAYLTNAGATLYGATIFGIEAGMLLSAAYVLSRRFWLPIGIFFGWNFMQAGVFGPNLSGWAVDSLLRSRVSGPSFVSGGSSGVEGSVFAAVISCGVGAWFLVKAQRRGQIVPPHWSSTRDPDRAPETAHRR
ncbi:MAG: CPBP family intramembrane metalloprotease [Acidobacteria bacterium]|nr:CPBP family intramembrane metalloprotease [Acidobacteriota bacterium]